MWVDMRLTNHTEAANTGEEGLNVGRDRRAVGQGNPRDLRKCMRKIGADRKEKIISTIGREASLASYTTKMIRPQHPKMTETFTSKSLWGAALGDNMPSSTAIELAIITV